MAKNYTITKSLLGKYSVKYNCPHCRVDLTSPLEEAGTTQACPHCGKEFAVPGVKERRQWEEKAQRDETEKQERAAQAEADRVKHIEEVAAQKLKANLQKQQQEQGSPGFLENWLTLGYARRTAKRMGYFSKEDFYAFRTMITVEVVMRQYIATVVLVVIAATIMITVGCWWMLAQHQGEGDPIRGFLLAIAGLGIMIIGPYFIRLWYEFVILFFRMNETLTETQRILQEQSTSHPSGPVMRRGA